MGLTALGSFTPITAASRFPSSRRGPAVSRAADAVHAKALGEVLHAWNRAHAALFTVFVRVATDNDFGLALAIWHTGSGDKVQREMLEAASLVRLAKRKSYLSAVKWALAAMAEIGTYRNDITHGEMQYFYTRLMPGMTVNDSRADRLMRRQLDKNWRTVRGDLNALAAYLDHIQFSLWMGMPRPLSRRPRLRFVHSSSARTQEQRRQAKKAGKQRQREASRP